MPFALTIWAGCSVGKVAAILRVAKWHSGVHWWKGLHACTQGGEATGPLKGTTKRGESSQGENALAYCMSKGASVGIICSVTLFISLIMHELAAYGAWADVWTCTAVLRGKRWKLFLKSCHTFKSLTHLYFVFFFSDLAKPTLNTTQCINSTPYQKPMHALCIHYISCSQFCMALHPMLL